MSSSTEAECHALVHVGKENIWVREFLDVLKFFETILPLVIFQDNKSAKLFLLAVHFIKEVNILVLSLTCSENLLR